MAVLEGKSVVITGAGRGLGEAYALLAAREGASVVVNDMDHDAAEAVTAAIRADGGSAVTHVGDITDWQEAERLVEVCVRHFGALDGLVNNAAVYHLARAEEETEARLRRIVEVNVLGSAFCAIHALRQMQRQRHGSLVNVTSGAHAGGSARFSYAATKGAVASMTYSLALDAKGSGVRINAVSPMGATRMVEANAAYHRDQPVILQRLAQGPGAIPPANCGPAVVYLLSDLSRGVHGQIVRIEGRQLSIMTHPATVHPGVQRDAWTVADVAAVFEAQLANQQLPLGMQAYEFSVRKG